MRLVVDLDGTLIRTDMLFESFWSAVSRDWRCIFKLVPLAFSGRAAVKKYLAQCSALDESVLPYNAEVLDYIRKWREKDNSVALVTASDKSIADRISSHLKLFDEVHGSDGTTNLKGKEKAEFLVDRFGDGNFSYMGDSSADIHVWKHSERAITVDASKSIKMSLEKLGKPVEHLQSSSSGIKGYVKELRPHQWLKNVLVFVPIITSHQFNLQSIFLALAAFFAFSFVASSVYVLNDLLDLSADRAHPRKRNRPFASGSIPISHGLWLILCPVFLGFIISFQISWDFCMVLILYFLLTIAYSLHLKRFYVIDICILALLFTLRIAAGGAAVGITLSVWLLAFSLFFFFSLASVKRQAELVDLANQNKLSVTGRGYHVDDLPIISMIAIGSGYVSVLVMALYINSPDVQQVYQQPAALWGISCILLYWITYIVMITHRGSMHDDPMVFAVKDRISIICGMLVLTCMVGGTLL